MEVIEESYRRFERSVSQRTRECLAQLVSEQGRNYVLFATEGVSAEAAFWQRLGRRDVDCLAKYVALYTRALPVARDDSGERHADYAQLQEQREVAALLATAPLCVGSAAKRLQDRLIIDIRDLVQVDYMRLSCSRRQYRVASPFACMFLCEDCVSQGGLLDKWKDELGPRGSAEVERIEDAVLVESGANDGELVDDPEPRDSRCAVQ
jgi:hypothetical protein